MRDRNDLVLQSAAPTPTPAGAVRPTATPGAATVMSIAAGAASTDREVVVEATVTASSDACSMPRVGGSSSRTSPAPSRSCCPSGTTASGRRSSRSAGRDDGHGVRGASAPRDGRRSARWDASPSTPLRLLRRPGRGPRLAAGRGHAAGSTTSTSSAIDGERSCVVGSARRPIVGQAGAGIPVDRVIEGRTAAIVGIVRRPTRPRPTSGASILPRSAADLDVGGGWRLGRARGRPGRAAARPAVATGGRGRSDGIAGADRLRGGRRPGRSGDPRGPPRPRRWRRPGPRSGWVHARRWHGGRHGRARPARRCELLALIEPDDVVNVDRHRRSDRRGLGRVHERPGSPRASRRPGRADLGGDAVTDPAATPPAAGGTVDLAGFDLPGPGPAGLAGIGTAGPPDRPSPSR